MINSLSVSSGCLSVSIYTNISSISFTSSYKKNSLPRASDFPVWIGCFQMCSAAITSEYIFTIFDFHLLLPCVLSLRSGKVSWLNYLIITIPLHFSLGFILFEWWTSWNSSLFPLVICFLLFVVSTLQEISLIFKTSIKISLPTIWFLIAKSSFILGNYF